MRPKKANFRLSDGVHKPARGFSDKNFRLCPSTDGRPYLLGFEKILTGMTGRGGKETG